MLKNRKKGLLARVQMEQVIEKNTKNLLDEKKAISIFRLVVKKNKPRKGTNGHEKGRRRKKND
jgi:hypothetical protein